MYKLNGRVTRLVENSKLYNDGNYHVVRFLRDGTNARMFVDNYPPASTAYLGTSAFKAQSYIYVGGQGTATNGQIVGGFSGILAGDYIMIIFEPSII